MKHTTYLLVALLTAFFTGCSNDDITIESNKQVTVTVNPKNLYATYDYVDPRNNVDDVKDHFEYFNSQYGKHIMVRVLFYDKATNRLVKKDSVSVDTENEVTLNINVPNGEYQLVSTLCFADNVDNAWAELVNEYNLKQAYLKPYSRLWNSMWNIFSIANETVTISGGMTPIRPSFKPVGSIVYSRSENFQYRSQSDAENGIIADNSIREIGLYSQQQADGYKLDPSASNRYVMLGATSGLSSYYTLYKTVPTDYNESWKHFRSNLYGYYFILPETANIAFGYSTIGTDYFNSYGKQTYHFSPGKVHLARWSYFDLDVPYLGLANDHNWDIFGTQRFIRQTVADAPVMNMQVKK